MLTIKNMDELVNKFVPKRESHNVNPLACVHIFRWVSYGPSGSGKTNIVFDMVMNHLYFDKLYLYAKDLQDPKYLAMIAIFENLEEKYNEINGTDDKLIEYSDSLDDINIDNFDKNKQNLVIFDDMITESKQNQKVIDDLFVRGRKTPNCSIIYQSQSVFDTPKLLRKQANYITLLKVDKGELDEIAKRYSNGVSFEKFKELYYECISQPFGFMLIDKCTNYGPLKIRCGFDCVLKTEDDDEDKDKK